jgi:hypothetical protein
MTLTNAQAFRAMQLLNLTQEDFRSIERAPTFEVGQQMLVVLKDRVKKQFRKVALELHPDRTNNDPVKTDEFKLVAAVVDDIEKLNLSRPPPPHPVAVRVVFRTVRYHSATSTTTTSFGGFGY